MLADPGSAESAKLKRWMDGLLQARSADRKTTEALWVGAHLVRVGLLVLPLAGNVVTTCKDRLQCTQERTK